MSLKASYTLLAPFYDLVAGTAFTAARRASLAALPRDGQNRVLINGVGSGLDLPFLPRTHRYVGLDLTRAMLVPCGVRRTSSLPQSFLMCRACASSVTSRSLPAAGSGGSG